MEGVVGSFTSPSKKEASAGKIVPLTRNVSSPGGTLRVTRSSTSASMASATSAGGRPA